MRGTSQIFYSNATKTFKSGDGMTFEFEEMFVKLVMGKEMQIFVLVINHAL